MIRWLLSLCRCAYPGAHAYRSRADALITHPFNEGERCIRGRLVRCIPCSGWHVV